METVLLATFIPIGYVLGIVIAARLFHRFGNFTDPADPLPVLGSVLWPVGIVMFMLFGGITGVIYLIEKPTRSEKHETARAHRKGLMTRNELPSGDYYESSDGSYVKVGL
jgi:hypothetical protein